MAKKSTRTIDERIRELQSRKETADKKAALKKQIADAKAALKKYGR